MVEFYKCYEIEIMNFNSLRGNFKQIVIFIIFYDGVGFQDLLFYLEGDMIGDGVEVLQDEFCGFCL